MVVNENENGADVMAGTFAGHDSLKVPHGLGTQERSELGRYLFDLVTHQDTIFQKWVEFLITIEAGLAVAAGFILRPAEKAASATSPPSVVVTSVALPAIVGIGVVVAVTVAAVAVRQQKWQGYYVEKFNNLPGFEDRIFPGGDSPRRVTERPAGVSGRSVIVLATFVVLAWTALAIFLWSMSSTARWAALVFVGLLVALMVWVHRLRKRSRGDTSLERP